MTDQVYNIANSNLSYTYAVIFGAINRNLKGGLSLAIEYELKYRATAQAQAAIRLAVQGPENLYEMQTTYYDTPSGALSGRKYTLRRRMENTLSVCTLKAPSQGHGRGEWETCCDDIIKAIPVLCQMGAPADLTDLTAEGIVPICGAKFTRIAKTIVFEDGVLELALDSGILIGGGRELPLCEVEVELKEGTPALADQYAKYLAQKFGLIPEHGSKFRRALALSKGEI